MRAGEASILKDFKEVAAFMQEHPATKAGRNTVHPDLAAPSRLFIARRASHTHRHKPLFARDVRIGTMKSERVAKDCQAKAGCTKSRAMLSVSGWRTTPRSVIKASMSPAGVTSKTGFQARASAGLCATPWQRNTSLSARSSMGIPRPSAVAASIVLIGATT